MRVIFFLARQQKIHRAFPKLTVVENKMRCDQMIRVRDIGLSKINRILAFFARRPQIQERLTEQVLLALQTLLVTAHRGNSKR